jgi:hypothetical protein
MHTGVTLLRVWKLDAGGPRPELDLKTCLMVQGFGIEQRYKTVFDGLGAFVDGIAGVLEMAKADCKDPVDQRDVRPFAAVERFVITAKSTTDGASHAMETIGSLKTMARLHLPTMFIDVSQKSNTKGTIKNTVLTELGLKKRGEGLPDHAYDSARHAVKMVLRFREMGLRAVAEGCWRDEHTRTV